MKAFGKIVARYKVLVILLAVALLIPAGIGDLKTKVN